MDRRSSPPTSTSSPTPGTSVPTLRPSSLWRRAPALVAALIDRGLEPTSLNRVLDGAPRQAQPLGRDEPPLRSLDLPVLTGWRWDAEDSATAHWFPQGITTTHDASASGRRDGREVVAVSWALYGHRAVRISVADLGSGGPPRYEHIALGVPVRTQLGVALAPVRVHAGGIAWCDDLLWVADTLRGLRAFSFERILGTPRGELVMPQVGAHRLSPIATVRGPRFSYLSLDRSEPHPALVTGEYRNRRPGARVLRWPVPSPGAPVQATAESRSTATNLQAVLDAGDVRASFSSSGTRPGRVEITGPAGSRRRPWTVGPEDVALAHGRDLVLSLTERPHGSCSACGRVVFGVSASALLG